MRTPSSSELLDAWAAAAFLGPTARALALLLAAAEEEEEPGALAALPLGRRDGRLLELRSRLFGPILAAAISCPGCGERLELKAESNELAAGPGEADADAIESIALDGWVARFRLPNSHDLAAVEGRRDAAAAGRSLLESCLAGVTWEGREVPAGNLPQELAGAIGRRMAELDPLAAPDVAVDCPDCGQQWQAPVDIAGFLWSEVDAWARRTLFQVHELASAYSWTEDTVLALSPAKRARYLELVAG